MALDNFRTQKIIWDRANKKIFEAIEANAGDSNGRKLVVQVINQEVTEGLSGTTLSLGWKSRNGAKGLDAFNVVDASKGIFEIYYTTEMLSNIGNIEASLILIDSTSRIESSTFTISVRPSTVDDESIESENSFTALTEALVKVNDFDAQLAQKADKSQIGAPTQTQVDDWLDRNPQATTTVEDYSLDTKKYRNRSVTPEKIYVNDVIKDFELGSHTSLQRSSDIVFISPDDNIRSSGRISVAFESLTATKGYILLFKKVSDTKFEVKDYFEFTSIVGVNEFETGMVSDGVGNEYLGVWGGGITYTNDRFSEDVGRWQSVSTMSETALPHSFLEGTLLTTRFIETSRMSTNLKIIITDKQAVQMFNQFVFNKEQPVNNFEVVSDTGKIQLSGDNVTVVSEFEIKNKGRLRVEYYSNLAESGKVFLLRKISNSNFMVVDIHEFESSVGYNSIQTDMFSTGRGNEFVGIYKGGRTFLSSLLGLERFRFESVSTFAKGAVVSADYHESHSYLPNMQVFVNSQVESPTDNPNNTDGQKPMPFLTLDDAFKNWQNGDKFPVAFYGDSTIDGLKTTGHIPNRLGENIVSPNAFPKKLEDKLKISTKNNNLRIYNSGFSGSTASRGNSDFGVEFGETSDYSDVKMMGIGFGINDRLLYNGANSFKNNFRNNIKSIVEKCYANDIQPFLLTTQAILSPDVSSNYTTQHPMRDAMHIATIANAVKKELADEYNLELIDINKFTSDYLTYSKASAVEIINDKLHFGDIGHEYEAQVIFAHFNNQTIFIDGEYQLDYTNQKLVVGVPEDKLTSLTSFTDGFKTTADYEKANSVDNLIFRAYVFNQSKNTLNLKGFKNSVDSSTYVKINEDIVHLNSLETTLIELDLGLYTLEVWTGENTAVDFKGFKLE